MKVLITGADGFIGKNLIVRLGELPGSRCCASRGQIAGSDLAGRWWRSADAVFHLAGVNRPQDVDGVRRRQCRPDGTLVRMSLAASGRTIPVILSRRPRRMLDNPYGRSKRAAEEALWRYADSDRHAGACVSPAQCVRQVVPAELQLGRRHLLPQHRARPADPGQRSGRAAPAGVCGRCGRRVYSCACRRRRRCGVVVEVRAGATASRWASWLRRSRHSATAAHRWLPSGSAPAWCARCMPPTSATCRPNEFAYALPKYGDARGVFVEMLKTPDSGQFSFFTAHPGITRGGHYHHTKTEKFLVIKGTARFGFRHIVTGETPRDS